MDESGKMSPGPTGTGTTLDPAIDVGCSVVDFREGVGVRVGGEELRRSSVDGSDVSSPRRRHIVIGSMTYRSGWGNSVQSSWGEPVPLSVGVARAGLVGLDSFKGIRVLDIAGTCNAAEVAVFSTLC